jgi:hypothetical protein
MTPRRPRCPGARIGLFVKDLLDNLRITQQANRFLKFGEAVIRQLAMSATIRTCYDPERPSLAEIRFFPIAGFKNDLIFYPSAMVY